VFVDVISLIAIKMAQKKLRKEEKVSNAITVEKKKEIVQKYECGVRVTDLANRYSMSRSTISTITHIIQPFFIIIRLGKGCFGRFRTHYGYFHYFLWEK
jgi:hypothetical protein